MIFIHLRLAPPVFAGPPLFIQGIRKFRPSNRTGLNVALDRHSTPIKELTNLPGGEGRFVMKLDVRIDKLNLTLILVTPRKKFVPSWDDS
jgi:hypothetical protein